MIKSVSVYVDGNYDAGHSDHLRVFTTEDAAKEWLQNLTHMDAPSNMICSVGNPAQLARVRHDRAQPHRATLTLSS